MPSQRVHMYVSTPQPAFSVNILEASFQLPPSPGGSETSGQLNTPSQMVPDLRVFSEGGEVEAGTVPKQQVSLLLESQPAGAQGSVWQGSWRKADSQKSRGGQASLPGGPPQTTHGRAPQGDTRALHSRLLPDVETPSLPSSISYNSQQPLSSRLSS